MASERKVNDMEDAARNPENTNVLLICCDHLRADWLGVNGHPVVMTPQIDKLARQGVNFTSAMSECPVCVPARRVLMTGLGPYSIHMETNQDRQPFGEGPKLAEIMTRAGWQTFASGKLHTWPERNRIGFEDVQLNEEGRKAEIIKDDYEAFLDDNGYSHLAYTHGLGNNQYGLRLSPVPEKFTTTHWTAEKAMEFLDRRDPTRPFFLYVSFDKPHPPITPPAEYYELYREAEFPAPPAGEWLENKMPAQLRRTALAHDTEASIDHPLMLQQTYRGFAAMITHIDSMIGAIIGSLREQGLLGNTMIVLTSDHGDNLFDHRTVAKCDFLRGSANVPLIIVPPKTWAARNEFEPGRVDAAPVGLADVMPSILEMCSQQVPRTVEGMSLVSRLRSPDAPFREHCFGKCARKYGITDGRWKYTWFGDDGVELLFDTQEDPSEVKDLSAMPEHADRRNALREALVGWMERNHDPAVATRLERPLDGAGAISDVRARAANPWNNRGRH